MSSTGSSGMLKAKKWAASVLGDTKLGRNKAVKLIGEDGYTILNGIDVATEKIAGKSTAKAMNKNIVKLLMKVGVLWKEGVITAAHVEPLQGAILAFANKLQEELLKRPGSIEPEPLSTLIRAAHDAVLPLLKPHMKERSWAKFTVTAMFYASAEFLTVFLNDPRIEPERAAVRSSLEPVLRAQDPKRGTVQVCSVNGCLLPRLEVRGTMYCLGHHALKYSEPLLLTDFLRNTEHVKLFKAYLLEAGKEKYALLEFWNKVDDFKSISSKAVLPNRAATLYGKYLSPDAKTLVPLETAIVERIVAELEAPKATLFNLAQERAFAMMDELFNGPFRSSPHFAEFATENLGYEVPPMNPDRLAELAEFTAKMSIDGGGGGGVPMAGGAGGGVIPK